MNSGAVKKTAVISLILGFLLTVVYQTTAEKSGQEISSDRWYKEEELRQSILQEQKENRQLEEEWRSLQRDVRAVEEEMAHREVSTFNLVEDLEKLRMLSGEVAVKGPGVEVTLNDHTYVPDGNNPNDYIVHERHIQQVVDELMLASAEAVSINGVRITRNSSIQCEGPVISVDNYTSTAPFVVRAIGDPDQLEAALELSGGVKDQLVNENIEVRMQQQSEILMDTVVGERET
ncbi:Uncharacterized conserved protein YlxW, UPF0749 family [Alteribacillus persepolensis]|uniref:Uncharacterized conserved protein YlxW, UPF0749 family n=1 Tax=Alteribacillus persepolensis TaxID=568899 RepID=A0A1G7YFU7_9BACI|nr:DUF881 domain-containing protein [Alteribacillus persepolensis]SDG95216.1 Uncharacterized conserved protein YlxW, UPF0749 family [Alteribacillus persepolensis]